MQDKNCITVGYNSLSYNDLRVIQAVFYINFVIRVNLWSVLRCNTVKTRAQNCAQQEESVCTEKADTTGIKFQKIFSMKMKIKKDFTYILGEQNIHLMI